MRPGAAACLRFFCYKNSCYKLFCNIKYCNKFVTKFAGTFNSVTGGFAAITIIFIAAITY